MLRRIAGCLLTSVVWSTVAMAAPAVAVPAGAPPATLPTRPPWAEHRIPLADGRVSVQRLLDTVGADAGLPRAALPWLTLDLSGDRGVAFCRNLGQLLGSGCDAACDGRTLTVRLDRPRPPAADPAARERVARLLVSGQVVRPAVLHNGRFGFTLPARVDPARPLVLLIHGLDSDNQLWGSMADLLAADGHQVAYFTYPDDGPIAASGDLLARCFAPLLEDHPGLTVRIVAHSMGGLVARSYVEGPAYRGGVDRFVMLGTPNHGSGCAGWRWGLELYEHYQQRKGDANWTWSRMSDDGNGEAGTDIAIGSKFLQGLNARPRRDGVRYTIVAGNQNTYRNVAAGWVDCTAGCFSANVWGLRSAHAALAGKAEAMRQWDCSADGPVTVESAKLDHVTDFTVVHADHVALACGHPPAAWAVVKDRLK